MANWFKQKNNQLILLIVLLALIGRLVLIFTVDPKPVVLDAESYDRAAKNILNHHTFAFSYPKPTAYTVPGFPLFLSLIYSIFGESNFQAVRIIQAILSSFMILIIALISSEIFDKKSVALLSAILSAIYIPFLVSTQIILTETIFILLFVLFFYYFLLGEKYEKIQYFVIAGLFLGLSCLVRPILFLFPAFLFIMKFLYLCVTKARHENFFIQLKKIVLKYFIIYILTLLTLSPWVIRNYKVFHTFILFSTSSGDPFFRGTYYNSNCPLEELHRKSESELMRNERLWKTGKEKFRKELKKAPIRYSLWYFSKINRLWALPFMPFNVANVDWRVLKITLIQHTIFIILSLIGLLYLYVDRNPYLSLIISILFYYTFMHVPFIGLNRYFLPMIPVLLILASCAVIATVQKFKIFITTMKGERLLFRLNNWLSLGLIIFGLFFLLLLQQNLYQSSAILNFDFHPVLLSKTFCAAVDLVIILYISLIVLLLIKRKFVKDFRAKTGLILFSIIFFISISSFKFGLFDITTLNITSDFKAPLIGDNVVKHLINLPSWTKGYKDCKLIIRMNNSDEHEIDYNMEILVNCKVIRSFKKGDKISGLEMIIPLDKKIIEENEKLMVILVVNSSKKGNYPILHGINHVFRGLSTIGNQYSDLSSEPGFQKGSYNIGLRLYGKSRLRNIYYWRGSSRRKLKTSYSDLFYKQNRSE
jgi:4-amino-4-deoxy-L-arabinose transferase-like glycosyltransferase